MIPALRRYEWLLLVFFAYVASVAIVLGRPAGVAAALVGAGLVVGVARVDAVMARPWSRVLRDWMAPAYILAAYWSLAPLARGPEARHFSGLWVQWDRLLLNDYRLRQCIEAFGAVVPGLLECVYLLLYGLPTALVGWFYWQHRSERLESFLEVLFACILLTYALIPLVPCAPPRLEFAGQDLPHYVSSFRWLSLWLQDGADITTGVFPSGHVTAALACLLGVRRAAPEAAGLRWSLALYAALLMMATVYGRYHYAADVLAALGVSCVATWLAERLADWHPGAVPEVAYARRRSSS